MKELLFTFVFYANRMYCIALFLIGGSLSSAAAFQNLDFELANVSNPVGNELPAIQGLPGWTSNNWHSGYIYYNDIALDSVAVSIHDNQSGFIKPLQGRYSAMLQDGQVAYMTPGSASISQTGDIPTNAKSLMFSSDRSDYINELQVSINGSVLLFSLYSTDGTVNSNYGPVKIYACDISAFTGQTDATLKFEKFVHDPSHIGIHGYVDLDAITFSTVSIPEPSSLVILAFGLFALATYSRLRCNSDK